MTRLLRTLFSAALVLGTLAAAPASAQINFDDFNDGNVDDVFAFFGGAANGGAGVGVIDGVGGAPETGLDLGVNPGDGGGFAGAVVTGGDGTVDITDQAYFSFWVRPTLNADNLPLLLEINFQEDVNGDNLFDPAVEDEFQAVFALNGDASYQFVQIPIASFTDDNTAGAGSDDGFDFSNVLQVVYAMGNIQGSPFTISFDELRFTQEATPLQGMATTFDDFNDGNVDDVFAFFGGAANGGAGVGVIDGVGGAPETGLDLGVNPGDGGGFAGAVVTGGDGTVDITDQAYFSFWVRPTLNADNLPLLLEINFQEDVNGDNLFDPAVEDEFQAVFALNGDASYQFVQIPIASFTDDNTAGAGSDDGFDFSNVLQVVYAMGNIQGSPFTISFDELAFSGGVPVAGEPLPTAFEAAPRAYPNPTAGAATVAFDLAQATDVSVTVVDLLGRTVATLADGARAAGPVRLGVPTAGLAPGLYVIRVQTDAGVASTRLSVAR